ncbi:MAG: aminoacyl-tRNA hydrolase [Actinobacteria bacterium]|nr:aminoacyl-tRNA hydrolase [Actinomycetota bacterium]
MRLRRPRSRQPTGRAEPLQVVVGLRNPGRDYEGTRHNIGYEVLARVAARGGVELGRSPSRIGALSARHGNALLVAPASHMNESGRVVRAVLDYWKTPVEDLLVIHDDIDLDFGRLRVQVGGGSGGHNGVRSVEKALGATEFSRLKVGVGRPPAGVDPADHVLRRFTRTEQAEVPDLVSDGAEVVERWLIDRARAQELAAHRGRDG